MSGIPTMEEVRAMLWKLNRAGLRSLSKKSGVPVTTLIGIRHSPTRGAEWDTVRGLLSHFDAVIGVEAHHSRQYRVQLENAAEEAGGGQAA